jgi:hypothetical protein
MMETASSSRSSKTLPQIKAQRPPRISDKTSFQCWAHLKSGRRCQRLAKKVEGEPIPIPYCSLHLKYGDGALRVIRHPIAGKCLVARFTLPPNYRIAFHGKRGPCQPCSKEDRAISFYPPNPITGKNRDSDGRIISRNYNGVLNPDGTGDLIQYAACPGPTERQNMR